MKKLFKLFLMFVLATILAFSMSACNFIDNSGGSNEDETNQEQTVEGLSRNDVNVNLVSSATLAAGITYTGVSHSGAEYSSVAAAIAATKVERASVSLIFSFQAGTILGSGTIVDIDDGVNNGESEDNIFYVLTNHHVIEYCETNNGTVSLYVPDDNGNNFDDNGYDASFKFTGKVGGEIDRSQAVSLVGGDKATDVAVLRLYVSNDAVASKIVKAKIMSTSYSLPVGEHVFAIGFAKGEHAGWVSDGLISDKNSTEEVEEIGRMSLLGISADIFPGNSGGGLFNLYGELVGITCAGDSFTDEDGNSSSMGINFAVPHKTSAEAASDTGFVNIMKQLIGTYLASGTNYGYVGGRADIFWFYTGLSGNYVAVASVASGSQAEGKVSVGDIVSSVKINSEAAQTVSDRNGFLSMMKSLSVGDAVVISFTRTGVYGGSSNFSVTFNVNQFLFCNTGDYTNITA